MDFYLQFGYGMMELSRQLLNSWGGGTVILSPRDLTDAQLERLAPELTAQGGSLLLDPQFYMPHADHSRLRKHAYWPDDYETTGFWNGPELDHLLIDILGMNRRLGCNKVILPGLYAENIDDEWLRRQAATQEAMQRVAPENKDVLATVALGSDALRSEDGLHELLEASEDWTVNGVYLICEHPKGQYIVTDTAWMANILDLVAGLRLQGRSVVIGYCNQQMLIAAAAGASAISSGTYMNVRSFPPEKFWVKYEEEQKQRTVWYYCPQALTEFKITFLDVARRAGLLLEMAAPPSMASTYVNALFAGAQPTGVGLSEGSAFRHYLHCIRNQASEASRRSFQETLGAHLQCLAGAQSLLERLHAERVVGGQRDMYEALDVNRAALQMLDNSRGPVLRRTWV